MSDTIIWGILAAAVLVGVVLVIKKKKNAAPVHSKKEPETSPDYQHIINTYGELLEEEPPVPSLLYDVDTLPLSKDIIKEACLWAIKQTDDTDTLDALKFSYLRLANYQEGIQQALLENGIEPFYGIVDPESIDMEKYLKWLKFHQERMPIVNQEMIELSDELKEID